MLECTAAVEVDLCSDCGLIIMQCKVEIFKKPSYLRAVQGLIDFQLLIKTSVLRNGIAL